MRRGSRRPIFACPGAGSRLRPAVKKSWSAWPSGAPCTCETNASAGSAVTANFAAAHCLR